MSFASELVTNCPGLIHPRQSCLPFETRRFNRIRFCDRNAVRTVHDGIPRGGIQYSLEKRSGNGQVHSGGQDYHQLTFDDVPEDPLWLSLIKEAVWALKSLFEFLAEQPSQLKYIEWPSFQDTLKTATLTLVLVALLIVALSSVDSLLSYLLALFLRRTA